MAKLIIEDVQVDEFEDMDEWFEASQTFYQKAEQKYGWTEGLVDTVKAIIAE